MFGGMRLVTAMVGIIQMNKLFLTGIAALFLATGNEP
jgi:hypothetical protein